MKNFKIVDCNRNDNNNAPVIQAQNGKSALKKFLAQYAMSTGFYEIHKRCNRWILSSSYGSYFVAMPQDARKEV